MRITIHRGTHEIGGSCVELENSTSRILLDMGMPLMEKDGSNFDMKAYAKLDVPALVEQKILPGIQALYSPDENVKPIKAVILSHGHPDHHGLTGFINPDIPLYSGKATADLMKDSAEFGLTNYSRIPDHFYETGQPVSIAGFEITPYLTDHSIFDSYSLVVKSEGKILIYSGDFRGYGRKQKAYLYFLSHAPKQADALLLEGTCIDPDWKGKEKTELSTEEELIELSRITKGIVLATFSVQNADRLVSFYKAARKTGRVLVVDFYSAKLMETLSKYARTPHVLGDFKGIKIFYPYRISDKAAKADLKEDWMYPFKDFRIPREDLIAHPEKYLFLARDSMLGDLEKMDQRSRGVFLKDAAWVWSLWSGYLKQDRGHKVVDFCDRHKISLESIHYSGHADFSTLKETVETLQPKMLVPIHTERPDLFDRIGSQTVMLEDGQVLEL